MQSGLQSNRIQKCFTVGMEILNSWGDWHSLFWLVALLNSFQMNFKTQNTNESIFLQLTTQRVWNYNRNKDFYFFLLQLFRYNWHFNWTKRFWANHLHFVATLNSNFMKTKKIKNSFKYFSMVKQLPFVEQNQPLFQNKNFWCWPNGWEEVRVKLKPKWISWPMLKYILQVL